MITLFWLGAQTRTASAKEFILTVLDTTGSMATLSLGGDTRMTLAKGFLTSQLAGFTDPDNEYALWFFDGTTFTEIVPFGIGNTAKASVVTAINTATPGGSTPLAHTICAAVDELATHGDPADVRRILLASDGEENSTSAGPPPDQCFGPGSSVLSDIPFDNNSWQNRVLKKLCTGDANSPDIGFCDFALNASFVVDVTQLFDFTPVTGFAATSAAAVSVPEAGARRQAMASAAAPPNLDQEFFSGIAAVTNGAYSAVTPRSKPESVFLAPGDANHDGCVTLLDRTQVLQDSGKPGNGFDDFNRNGVVDNGDLQVVLQHAGECIPFIATAVPLAIPDNNKTGATAVANVSSPVLKIKSVKADVDITHPIRGDLVIQVVSPSGQAATLSNRQGGDQRNFVVSGLDLTKSFTAGSAAQGSWRLVVRDLAGGNVGTINRFRLTFTTSP